VSVAATAATLRLEGSHIAGKEEEIEMQGEVVEALRNRMLSAQEVLVPARLLPRPGSVEAACSRGGPNWNAALTARQVSVA
jgi:hypothetical protein